MESWIIVIAVLTIAVVIGYADFQNARAFRVESSTTLSAVSALDALQTRLARDGWTLGYRDNSSLIMSADTRAALGSTAAIGCFSVWLGLLHAVSSQKTVTVQVDVATTATGCTIVTNGSRSGNGALRYVAARLNELPKG